MCVNHLQVLKKWWVLTSSVYRCPGKLYTFSVQVYRQTVYLQCTGVQANCIPSVYRLGKLYTFSVQVSRQTVYLQCTGVQANCIPSVYVQCTGVQANCIQQTVSVLVYRQTVYIKCTGIQANHSVYRCPGLPIKSHELVTFKAL